MGYIVAIVVLLIVVPLLVALLTRRSGGRGGVAVGHRDRGVTHDQPAAEEITPSPPGAVNPNAPPAGRRLRGD